MIGLSTYAYFWRFSERVSAPLSLDDMLRDAARLGADLFQFCDFPAVESLDAAALAAVRDLAGELGLTLELGTRGTDPVHLERFLAIAEAVGARLVRSMWTSGDDRPSAAESEARLRRILPAFERAGVTLALETYEQVPSTALVDLIEAVGSPNLGICLDPANTVANLELPADVTTRCLPHVKNWHVKDFDFTREAGWVGFSLVGVPLGEGRLPYDDMLLALDPSRRGINQVIEHWLPWQGDEETTVRLEAEWTEHNLSYLRSKNS